MLVVFILMIGKRLEILICGIIMIVLVEIYVILVLFVFILMWI